MATDVNASDMVLLESSHSHGLPLLGRVRMPAVPRRQSSYSALRLPDPLRPWLRFPSPSAYPRASACSSREPICARGHELPRGPLTGPPLSRTFLGKHLGLPGSCTFLCVRARSQTPRRVALPSLDNGHRLAALNVGQRLGITHRNQVSFEADTSRPTRSRTYA